jgi:hypothetical protein
MGNCCETLKDSKCVDICCNQLISKALLNNKSPLARKREPEYLKYTYNLQTIIKI